MNADAGNDRVNVRAFTGPLADLILNLGAGTDVASLLSGTTVTINDPEGFTLDGSNLSTLLTVNSDGLVGQTTPLQGTTAV